MSTDDLIVLAGAVAAIVLVNWYFFVAGRTIATAMPLAASGTRSLATDTAAEIEIVVDGGYTPNTIRAKVGQPLRLIFDRKDDSSCAEDVVIPAFGIKRFLPNGERTAIEIVPREAGRIPFTCGMGMLKGAIIVDA